MHVNTFALRYLSPSLHASIVATFHIMPCGIQMSDSPSLPLMQPGTSVCIMTSLKPVQNFDLAPQRKSHTPEVQKYATVLDPCGLHLPFTGGDLPRKWPHPAIVPSHEHRVDLTSTMPHNDMTDFPIFCSTCSPIEIHPRTLAGCQILIPPWPRWIPHS